MKALPLKFQRLVNYGRWLDVNKFDFIDAGVLLYLVDAAFKAGVRECNVKDYSADKQRKEVEAHAKKMGLKTTWPGLQPAFTKRGAQVFLPMI